MVDPRITLAHGTLTGVFSESFALEEVPLYPRTTQTHPDEDRLVKREGLYTPVDQAPVAEGEMILYFYEVFGQKLVDAFVGVEINGVLQWKTVDIASNAINADTGNQY